MSKKKLLLLLVLSYLFIGGLCFVFGVLSARPKLRVSSGIFVPIKSEEIRSVMFFYGSGDGDHGYEQVRLFDKEGSVVLLMKVRTSLGFSVGEYCKIDGDDRS